MLDDIPAQTPTQLFVKSVNGAWSFDFSPASIAILLLFVLFFVGGWIGLSIYYRRRLVIQNQWLALLNMAYEKGLSQNQIQVLQAFFFQLPGKLSRTLLNNLGAFQHLLAEYLMGVALISNELKVRMLDRLFLPGADSAHSIEKIGDLMSGETIGLEIGEKHFLGTVIETKESDSLVCIPNWGPPQGLEGKETKLYAYRPDIGGYLFSGSILSTKKDCVYFRHSGAFESKVYFHMMVEQELPVKFISWPQVDESVAPVPVQHPAGEGEMSIPLAKKNIHLYGQTYKISDRALSFSFKTEADWKGFHENDQIIWEMDLLVPDGSTFVCRGKMMSLDQQSGKRGVFFFKFIDMVNEEHDRLFHWIQENHPVKEKMTI